MEKTEKRSMKLYETEIRTLLSLPEQQGLHIIKALLANSVGEELPELDAMETAVYTLVNAQLERADELSRKRAQAVNSRWDRNTNGQETEEPQEKTETESHKNIQTGTNQYTNTNTITSTITNTNTTTNTITGGMGEAASAQEEPEESPCHEKQRKKMSDIQQERFERFWESYPKKQGKGAAENAWKKIKPSAELLEKMLETLEQAKRCVQWQKEGGQYIPNPATWLNQKRWNDDYKSLSPARKPLSAEDYGDDEDIPQW